MKVINAHAHIGDCCVFGLNVTEEQLIQAMDDNGVETAIVQPFPGARDAGAVHDRIAAMAHEHPGRIRGLVSINPHYVSRERYLEEVQVLVRDLGFVGLKLHTIGHALNPLSADAENIFEAADRLRVPVMVHTGTGIPFSLPSMLVPRARQFPQVKIILAHSGAGFLSAEALTVTKECPNVYLETSWCHVGNIPSFVKAVGAGRVMFGSDMPKNLPVELAKYQASGLNEEQMRHCYSETAVRVFGL